jgi:hypothetical protein
MAKAFQDRQTVKKKSQWNMPEIRALTNHIASRMSYEKYCLNSGKTVKGIATVPHSVFAAC